VLKAVIDCQGCDNTITELTVSNWQRLIARAYECGWRTRGTHGHLCPDCVKAEMDGPAVERTHRQLPGDDAVLAASAAEWVVPE
jgi:hypothetical protein